MIRKCLKIICPCWFRVWIKVLGLFPVLCPFPSQFLSASGPCFCPRSMYMSAQNWKTVKNRLSENLVWSKFRSDLSFLIIIWRLTFKNDAFSLNSTEFTRWAYPSNCIWFTCDHDRYVWLNQIKNSLYLAWIPRKFVIFSEKLYLWSRWICLCFKSFLKRNRSCHFVIIWTLVGRFDFFRVLRVHRIVILFVLELILSYVFKNMFLPWGRSEV